MRHILRYTSIVGILFLLILNNINCPGGPNEPPDPVNQRPNEPTLISPALGATNQPLQLTLTWDCTDPNGDNLTYDIYFGTQSNPSIKRGTINIKNYSISNLSNSQLYYWKIIAKDRFGATSSSPVWQFTTKSVPVETVSTPAQPAGVNSGQVNETLSYTASGSSSSLGHAIEYHFDWGDGNFSGWSSTNATHSWSTSGTYYLKTQARCVTHTGIVSNWSSSKSVVISEFVGPELTVSTNNLDFGSSTNALTFNITNSGNDTLIWDITDNQDWITVNPISGTTITETDQVNVTVDRNGLSSGTHTGTITVSSNGGDELISVSIEVLPDPPVCSVSTTSLNFGDVLVGGNKSLSFTISNVGGGTLIGTVAESCNHYSIVSGNGSYSLNSGQSKIVTVSFNPTSEGSKTCNIAVSGGCADVSCTGEGIKCGYTVTRPSSGDIWDIRETRNIRWNPENAGSNVKIELYKGSSRQCTIHSNTTNDGLYSWVVDDCNGGSSANYRIKVTDLDDGSCYDYSPYFEIQKVTQIIVINPTADSWVMESGPTSNFGSADYLLVGRDNDGTRFESMIMFNTVLNDIPAEAVVEKAELILERQSYTGAVDMWVWVAWPLWYEYTVNYSSQIFGLTPSTSFSATSGSSTLYINVTNQVRAWRSGDRTNYGFWLGYSSTPSSGSFVKFGSREASSRNRPRLKVWYK